MEQPKAPADLRIEDLLEELPPLNPALVQGNCNKAPLPHVETQGEVPEPEIHDEIR